MYRKKTNTHVDRSIMPYADVYKSKYSLGQNIYCTIGLHCTFHNYYNLTYKIYSSSRVAQGVKTVGKTQSKT